MNFRMTWVQPEDLVPHLLHHHKNNPAYDSARQQWAENGGDPNPPRGGVGIEPHATIKKLAREILDSLRQENLTAPPWEQTLTLLPTQLPATPVNTKKLYSRIHGAWLGRAAACVLGKPVEKIPREGIEAILRSAGKWPLEYYFSAAGVHPATLEKYPWNKASAPTCLVENMCGAPEYDDLNYPMLNLGILEECGKNFTTDDVARTWLLNSPAGKVFTAERIAYRNLLNGHPPDVCALIENPYQDWIGALIRADVYGWVHPGNPRAAAQAAWTDARLSHSNEGIYGAMWSAALTSLSLTETSVFTVLEKALHHVPATSRVAQAAIFGASLGASDISLSDGLDALHEQYAGLHWVHVVNNVASIAYALARGNGDFDTAITSVVMVGWDTDSAGATVGSVMGGLVGDDAIPEKWTKPLRNQIASSMPNRAHTKIDSLAQATMRLAAQ